MAAPTYGGVKLTPQRLDLLRDAAGGARVGGHKARCVAPLAGGGLLTVKGESRSFERRTFEVETTARGRCALRKAEEGGNA